MEYVSFFEYLCIKIILCMKLFMISLFFSICFVISAQVTNNQLSIIDIKHYAIELKVNDSTNRIEVKESVLLERLDETKKISLDLTSLNSEGKGMVVESIFEGNFPIKFKHENDKLIIDNLRPKAQKEIELKIVFSGIPIDGLVIGENKYGNRTFFGDNWPNRAHNWFACVDHPSDKATVQFSVQAPNHYQVIANGEFIGKSDANNSDVIYEYSSTIPLPTKVMVVGIAAFKIQNLPSSAGVNLSSWVYPENEQQGFFDFDLASSIVPFFVMYLGPYEYEKLANVQSTTRFGGMENAGCIFYDENSINGKRTCETLLVHEIAHQWFGNSASEKEWQDIWLSEGFATYFTNLYLEEVKGTAVFRKQMEQDRSQVIQFYSKYNHPIVDTSYTELMNLLNPNSYQKGAWVLHMLRRELGDELFKKGIIAYYRKYRLSNASTDDFKNSMEEVSGLDLNLFFQQWLYQSGHPVLSVSGEINKKSIQFIVQQTQKSNDFSFPLTIELTLKKGEKLIKVIEINERNEIVNFETPKKVKSWKLDPFVDLLFEQK
jgi:aminopeptidase N